MSTLKELKAELESLTSRVNEAIEKEATGDYVLTKQQMIGLMDHMLRQAQSSMEDQLRGSSIDDSHISLSIDYNNKVEIDIDEQAVVSEIVDNVDLTLNEDDIIHEVNMFLGK